MNLLELSILAVGLSMDAFAVAVCAGLAMQKVTPRKALIVGLYFGGFQAVMPLIGYFAAGLFAGSVIAYGHWVAFGLLSVLGGKMIIESLKRDKCPDSEQSLKPAVMLPLAIATSIDALAVGVSFAFLEVSIAPAVSFIGIATLVISMAGVKIGNMFGVRFKSKAQISGYVEPLHKEDDKISEKQTLSGRDADPPRAKPPRRKFHPALIAATLVVVFVLTNNAVAHATGFNFLATLFGWTQDAVVFGNPTDDDREIHPEYEHLRMVIEDILGIQVDLPHYMPEGFSFDTIEPDEPTEYSNIVAWFVRGEDEFSLRVKRKMPDIASFSEINSEEESEIFKGKYLIASNMHRLVAIWYDGIYELSIHGDLTYEELTQILDSI
jgi:putative Mn2+ efflux pump MntP